MVATLFFVVITLATCTLFATLLRVRRHRRQLRSIHPASAHQARRRQSLRAGPMEVDEDELDIRGGRVSAWLAADAAPPGSEAARARAEFIAQQQRIVEMQMADEERALAHAVESSLSNRSEPDRPPEESALQQALEASIVTSVLALPTQKWSAVREAGQEEEECALCMELFVETDEVRVLKCKHYFHTKCIDQWLVETQRSKSRSCPLCQICPI